MESREAVNVKAVTTTAQGQTLLTNSAVMCPVATTRRHLRVVPDPDDSPRRRPEPRRRQPRDDRAGYRLHVELNDIKPAIWREFEIASDVHLDELHDVVQIVMGWTDSHLHRFGVGDNWDEPDTAQFITQFDADEGEQGVLETEVRIDEILQNLGDRLLYIYDFGDDWQHTITLQGERALSDDSDHRPRCLAGARACPPEDCGGVPGYAELATDLDRLISGDRLDEWRWHRLRWLARDQTWEQVKAGLEEFDLDEVNATLDRHSRWKVLSGELGNLIRRAPAAPFLPDVIEVIERIPVHPPVDVDPDLARAMTEPFAWMVRHIGDGLKLTAAGNLGPDDVAAVAEKLGLVHEWVGPQNRETPAPQAADFRMAMRDLGLARQSKGWLLPTKIARTLAADPVRLWWHIAKRLPLGEGPERDVALIGLVLTAAGVDHNDATAGRVYEQLMTDLGWRYPDGDVPRSVDSTWRFSRTRDVLVRAGGFTPSRRGGTGAPTAGGILLARAALT